MALRPTIYKALVSLSDLERQVYDTLSVTVAKHPSETNERMMVRILAYCIHADARLKFSRGLSATDEPDLWSHTLDDQVSLWIDVGEPSLDRIKKASRSAKQAVVYSFNTKSSIWWKQLEADCQKLPVSVFRLPWDEVEPLTQLIDRKIEFAVTISGQSAYLSNENHAFEVSWSTLYTPAS